MTVLLLLVSLIAGAQEPAEADDGVEASINEEGILEVVVWGEDAIRAAREAIERDLDEMGYQRVRTRDDGSIVFKPPRTWMSRVVFSREGTLSFTRPVVAYQSTRAQHPLEVDDNQPLADELPGGDYQALGRDPGAEVTVSPRLYVLPTQRRLDAVNDRVLREVDPELRYYRAVIQETAFQESLFELPGRLDRLWREGVPLTGGEPIEGQDARRQAVLEYWATRADTPRGRQVCDAVEVWLTETVQVSDHPVTAEEVERYNAQRSDGEQLSLVTP